MLLTTPIKSMASPITTPPLTTNICYRANIIDAKPGPHTFRHTAAINYLRNGGDEFTLQIMLGHTTLAMTRRYTSTLGTEDMMRVHKKVSPVDNLKL
ncbi:conserved domain protein [Dehalococcoides mccartyi 195]|uniref:Conserved domain protein n=2 Tax=Dehalococcoides mccartyi TaxID=61435 RepID=Q3ZAB4_DEHM1|nr:conserved domain protein [Dehalococcoides mccartyi 195]